MIKIIINNNKMLVIAMLVGVSSLYSSMMKVWQIKLDVECLLLDSKEIQLYGLSWNLRRFRVATTKVTWWIHVVVLSLLCLVASPVSYCLPLARSAKRLPLCLGGLYFIILTQLITYESLFTLLQHFIPIPGGITLFLSKSWTMRWLPLGYLLVLISYSISVTVLS